jgi:hypothetical protein
MRGMSSGKLTCARTANNPRQPQKPMTEPRCEREHDFALVLTGVPDLTDEVEGAIYSSGCDDATLSLRSGAAILTFSRQAPTLKDAILSAIRDVRNAGIGADVLRVDTCDLVTQSDIARRTGRKRQQIHQYIAGLRGPGGFPAPACQITDGKPLWYWCEVAYWLRENNLISASVLDEAEQLAIINGALDLRVLKLRDPALTAEVMNAVGV